MKKSLVLVLALCTTALTARTTTAAPTHLALSSPAVSQQLRAAPTHLALSSPAVSQQFPAAPTRLAMSSPAQARPFPGCRYQCSDLNW
jgi:hypothetical protein